MNKYLPYLKHHRGAVISASILLVGFLISAALLTLPTQQTWTDFHFPHVDNDPLPFSSKLGYSQTLTVTGKKIDAALLQLVGPLPRSGHIHATLSHGPFESTSVLSIESINERNFLLFQFDPVPVTNKHDTTLTLTTDDISDPIGLAYQIDSTKYPEGELTRLYRVSNEHKEIQGDVAFAVRVQTSPRSYLPSAVGLGGLAAAALVGWLVLSYFLLKPAHAGERIKWNTKSDLAMVGSLLVIIILAYFPFIRHIPDYCTNADYQKDVLYAYSSQQALRQMDVPYWHHYTCGGQPLLGNIEANTFSAVPVISLLVGPSTALNLVIFLEVVIGALGVYVLARWFKLSPLAALWPAIIFSLHGFIPNRIFLGHTMYIGGMALAPWLIFTYVKSLTNYWYVVLSAGIAFLMLGRGDTHVLFYSLLALTITAVILSLKYRQMRPLASCGMVGLMFILFSAPKILPALEAKAHFSTDKLPKHVALLSQADAIDDLLLLKRINPDRIKVEHGELEHWENIGSYTGILPIIVGIIGILFLPKQWRWTFISIIVLFFLIAEGNLYDQVLRKLPLFSSVMRLPSRSIWVAVLFLGLSGAWLLQYLLKRFPRTGTGVAAILLIIVTLDLASYTYPKLKQLPWIQVQPTQVSATQRTAFADLSAADKQYISIAQAGATIRGSCPDFNSRAPFNLSTDKPLVAATLETGEYQAVPASLAPNTISFSADERLDEFVVQSVPSRMLSIANGVPLPDISDGFRVLRIDPQLSVGLHYRNPTLAAGVTMAAATVLSSLVLGTFLTGVPKRAAKNGAILI